MCKNLLERKASAAALVRGDGRDLAAGESPIFYARSSLTRMPMHVPALQQEVAPYRMHRVPGITPPHGAIKYAANGLFEVLRVAACFLAMNQGPKSTLLTAAKQRQCRTRDTERCGKGTPPDRALSGVLPSNCRRGPPCTPSLQDRLWSLLEQLQRTPCHALLFRNTR